MDGRPHKDPEVWKESIDLVQKLYKLLKNLSSEEKYGIIIQLKRAAILVPSNISESIARRLMKKIVVLNLTFYYVTSSFLHFTNF